MRETNQVLQLTEKIYELTGGLCKAVAGPMEIHIGYNASSHSAPISISIDVPSYEEMSKLKLTDSFEVKTVGYFIDTKTLVIKDDIANLQKDINPETQTMVNALLELWDEDLTVTLQDFMDAFEVIVEEDMRAATGCGKSPISNSETELEMENEQSPWEIKM